MLILQKYRFYELWYDWNLLSYSCKRKWNHSYGFETNLNLKKLRSLETKIFEGKSGWSPKMPNLLKIGKFKEKQTLNLLYPYMYGEKLIKIFKVWRLSKIDRCGRDIVLFFCNYPKCCSQDTESHEKIKIFHRVAVAFDDPKEITDKDDREH